jgi:hypothetical protein
MTPETLIVGIQEFQVDDLLDRPLSVVELRRKWFQSYDSDSMGSIPAIPDAQNVPLLLCRVCHERFNEASLSDE